MTSTTKSALTEANQQEMQRELEQLASSHKKAKLQELFTRQDELRPYPIEINDNNENNPRSQSAPNLVDANRSNEEIEAMKHEFNDLQKKQLDKQISKQFLLRSDEAVNDVDAQIDEKKQGYGSGSDTSGEQKVSQQDITDMRAEFDKYQKKILSTQIEKSFRLRTSIDITKKFEPDQESIQEMKQEFQKLNKMMVRMISTKTIEMGIANPEIKPKHHEQFNSLMRDIGIVNQVILDNLWLNIEKTVNQNYNNDEFDDDDVSFKTDDDFVDDEPIVNENITIIQKLENENKLLRQRMKYMEEQISSLEIAQSPVDSLDDQMLIVN